MVSDNEFSPAVGAEVVYDGHVGEIRFVSDKYLTLCIRKKDSNMIGDCCLVIYNDDWHDIKMLKSTHRQ